MRAIVTISAVLCLFAVVSAAAPWQPSSKDIVSFSVDSAQQGGLSVDRAAFGKILDTYHVVTRQQWLKGYSHVAFHDTTGTVTFSDREAATWLVRLGGLATIAFADGRVIFLALSQPAKI